MPTERPPLVSEVSAADGNQMLQNWLLLRRLHAVASEHSEAKF
jgi:hypothetical protein